MSKCWIIGRETRIGTNGHTYAAEPYIVFETEDQAIEGKKMIESVSGENVRIVEAAFFSEGTTRS